jgi:uncharacterized protein YbjT (DUF2867 family)
MTTILVTAAHGTVGRRLVPLLRERGATVRTYDRTTEPDQQLVGVDAVFLACPNVPEQVAYECAVIDAAARTGVERLVKLSARGAAIDSPVAFWDWHARIEQHLAGTGIPAVVLRPSFSMANLLAHLDVVRGAGLLPVPAAEARVAMVDPADVAAAAATALTADDAPVGIYELTGPAAIGFAEVAAVLTAVVARLVSYLDVPPDQAVPAMLRSGVPPFAAEQIAAVFAALRAGAQSEVTDDLSRLTGRAAGGLRGFLADHEAVAA